MNTRHPPLLITLFSYLFIFIGAASLIFLPLIPLGFFNPNLVTIGFFGFDITFGKTPILFLISSIAFSLAGLTGLFIIRRLAFAYDFGICYCFFTLGILIFLFVSGIPMKEHAYFSGCVQIGALTLFLIYAISRRRRWIG